jgi:hypothetical protein
MIRGLTASAGLGRDPGEFPKKKPKPPSIMAKIMKNTLLRVFSAGIWISLSEFLRNEILFKAYWVGHFYSLGLRFETLPINGALWIAWSFSLAYLVFRLLQRFSLLEAVSLAWLPAFAMMWISLYNLQVMPVPLLLFAVPLSILEVTVAAAIIGRP